MCVQNSFSVSRQVGLAAHPGHPEVRLLVPTGEGLLVAPGLAKICFCKVHPSGYLLWQCRTKFTTHAYDHPITLMQAATWV